MSEPERDGGQFLGKRRTLRVAFAVATLILLLATIAACASDPERQPEPAAAEEPEGDTTNEVLDRAREQIDAAQALLGGGTMNERTREYITTVQHCRDAVVFVLVGIEQRLSVRKVADAAKTARDLCAPSSYLAIIDTDGFGEAAALARRGVQRLESAMNAFLAYLDTREQTKLIEVHSGIREGDRQALIGLRQINARRMASGLRKVDLLD